ncbi:MAG: AbrB/MazE/SpoVT family DNA-binding domain-containing protein [Ghiorsea sp.]|nr:AbrB/MazE/SpoVT family DNA-binding domain-containing protein [Ghiorsea sp.]
MKEVMLDIKKWGNSLGVRLPAVIAREAHLHSDQKVKVSVIGDKVIITPVEQASLTLEQRLEKFDRTARYGGEVMSVEEHLGAEKW